MPTRLSAIFSLSLSRLSKLMEGFIGFGGLKLENIKIHSESHEKSSDLKVSDLIFSISSSLKYLSYDDILQARRF